MQGIGAGAVGNAVVLLPLLLPQGHLASPGESVLWLLITQLAYGCMALARSTNSYGSERHLFLQQECQVRHFCITQQHNNITASLSVVTAVAFSCSCNALVVSVASSCSRTARRGAAACNTC
jgi:hypothetical protein